MSVLYRVEQNNQSSFFMVHTVDNTKKVYSMNKGTSVVDAVLLSRFLLSLGIKMIKMFTLN